MRTIESNGLYFSLVGVFNSKPLYVTQLPNDSHFYYVKAISSHRYSVSRTDINDHDEWIDETATFDDAARVITEQFEEPW